MGCSSWAVRLDRKLKSFWDKYNADEIVEVRQKIKTDDGEDDYKDR